VNAAWGTPLTVFYCPHCRAAHLAPANTRLPTCPACMQSAVHPEPERMRREPPELVIPFTVDQQRASSALSEWSRGVWFRPPTLRADLLLTRFKRYHLPLWLVDCDVEATWQAEMGYDYQTASFQERYQGGQWLSQEVTETRVRWEPRVGRLRRRYENVAVAALEDHEWWMSRLGGYDYRTRRPFAPADIGHSVVRVPDLKPEAAWGEAEVEVERVAAMECQSASEADHVRNWGMRAKYVNVHWTQMLVPLYVTHYREGERSYPVWINGQSGQVYGMRRMSQRRAANASLILGIAAALLALAGVLPSTLGVGLVALPMAGVVLVVVGLLLGLLAPVPATWAWLHNRREAQEGSAG
jgi:hypothetical protein